MNIIYIVAKKHNKTKEYRSSYFFDFLNENSLSLNQKSKEQFQKLFQSQTAPS